MTEILRAELTARTPIDERERRSIATTLAELDRLHHPYDEHADPTHVTGSAVVVGRRGVILLLHKRIGIWLQPGGHIEAGESPAQAALRETVEEVGIAVTHPATGPELVHVDVHPAGGHTHLDVRYLLHAPDADPAPGPAESQQVRWFSWDEAVTVADESLAGCLRHLRHRQLLPPDPIG